MKRTQVLLGGSVLILALVAACGPDPCVSGFEENDRFHVTMVETYTVASSYTVDSGTLARLTRPACAPPFGKAAGDAFDFKVVSGEEVPGASCTVSVGAPYWMSGFSIGTATTGYLEATRNDLLQTANEVSVAGCNGVLRMQLISVDRGDPLRTPQPGTVPPVVLLWDMAMDSSCMSLPAPCQQLWVVELTRP